MNAPLDDMLAEDARLWAIRVGAPGFADWDAFTAWLDAAPTHNRAYDAALEEIEAIDSWFDASPEPASTLQIEPYRVTPLPRWRMQAVAACAAAAAIAGGWFAIDSRHPVRQEYVTAPGERRTVLIADGSHIVLNGGTRLSIDAANSRDVSMVEGEALFDVRHDASRPFVITTAGGTRLVDVGTRFNVDASGEALAVAVAEGAVVYQGGRHGGGDIRLDAGQMLSRTTLDTPPVRGVVAPDEVGTWRSGQLHYTDAPLADVAADLSRNIGVRVSLDGSLTSRRFSGTITLDGGAAVVMSRVGPVLDVAARRQGPGWRLISVNGASP